MATTVLYLLALQDCTKFPFTVADKINQGMDDVNDRNTINDAMRRNQALQYFVLFVMNGPFGAGELNKPITFDHAFDENSSDRK
jgi:hypothetical protein